MKKLHKEIDLVLQIYLPDDYFVDLRKKLIPKLAQLLESKHLHKPVVGGPGSDVRSEGEQLPAEGQGEANMCAGVTMKECWWYNNETCTCLIKCDQADRV